MIAKENLTIYQGSTFIKDWFLNDSGGVPRDLTGDSVLMQIRKFKNDTGLILDLYADGYITIPNGADGKISIDIPASITADLDFETGVYDVEIHKPNGFVERIVEGKVVLSKEVTKGNPVINVVPD